MYTSYEPTTIKFSCNHRFTAGIFLTWYFFSAVAFIPWRFSLLSKIQHFVGEQGIQYRVSNLIIEYNPRVFF